MGCRSLIFLSFAVGINGWLFSPSKDPVKPEWDRFSATFLKYKDLPMNVADAKKGGWTLTRSCQEDAYFRGNRYVLNNDHSVMLLFDSKGKIAGIQNGIQKSSATQNFYTKPHWVEDGSLLVITAYFVDPKVICAGGREESKYLGDSLFIQNGASPSSLMEIPLKEDVVEKKTKWVKGKCVYGMGQHYWYDISNEMSCDDFFPAFLLYNGGKLNAFGWVTMGNFKSERYEHPPSWVLGGFFQDDTMPSCVSKIPELSTIHIYLQHRPYFNVC
ncbi:uncharacterized protein LOC114523458 [Dendronephthya gigantea]|uniref:uncharacterized protein LOC114523458 n=1 Tax=Dendronephthya gigantea TaxID=151771 RepID=UPI00106BB76E|nr:uncharacterized protein LOC114523458 [Dendronephthya gigantea]